jgi:hypothetical protein
VAATALADPGVGAGRWDAVVHVAFPSLTIDVVTLGLLAVAALPWLAPVPSWRPR